MTNTTVIVQLVGNPGATSVIVSGKDEFKERVEQDLEMMRSSPLGRRMLQSFDRASTTVTDKSGKVTKQGVTLAIVQTSDDKGAADWANRNTANPQPYLDPNHPADLTENSLRREMNREKRNHYAVTKKIRV